MRLNEQSVWKKMAGLLFFVLAVLWADPSAAFAGGGRQQPSESGGVVEFKYPEWVYYDLIYLADDLGYFDDAGVRPRYVGQIAAGQMIPALATGDLDVANRHTPLVVAAVAGGADIRIFAAGSKSTQADPHMKYFVRADSPIRSIKDFGGKTLGINSFGACSEYVTKKYCLDNGVDPTSIRMITAPDAEQEIPLLRGDTDIAIIHPLSSGRASANTTDFRLLFSDWDIDGGISGMCPYSVSGDFLKKHPEAIAELTAILSRAAQWNNEHREEARALMARRFGFKIEETEMFEFYPDQIIPELNIRYWLDRLEAEKKLTPGQVKPDQVFTNQHNPANRA
ncbi:MAG: ABC transporter substrate-binding protein [Treponema sp.]|jgi:ABC-type nitrate/sulfonate/bicarbonate transport system substrate-binding protein|nr:ABC transporter substrate-binding protein [Treponema sp.]